MKKYFFILLLIFYCTITPAFGHGLGGEVLPPVLIQDQKMSLSIGISPSIFDEKNPEKFISLRLFDSNTDAIIEHVTFEFALSKDGNIIFKDLFHDELGNLKIKVITDNSNQIKINGKNEPILGGWMKDDHNSLVMSGPVFTSGGLYDYNVKILSVHTDTNVLDNEILLLGGISIAETKSFHAIDSKKTEQLVQIISYFDNIVDFDFKSNQIEFSMPFDWNQDIEQLSVVHQEIRIPNTFDEFLSTTYNAYLNGIELPDETITIDDYSFDDRTIHIVVNQNLIRELVDKVDPSSEMMFFQISPSDDVGFPLEFTTPDLRYKVYLSWEPKIIQIGKEVTFFVTIEELFSDKTKKIVEYDLDIIKNNSKIFSKHLIGNVNSEKPNEHKIKFEKNHSGSVNMVLSNIDGNSLSKGNFILVISNDDGSNVDVSFRIPYWIKNNAGWWADNIINDDSFIQGIQYLIKEGIIKIPSTQQGEPTSKEIPYWIKNNAGWWADNIINDDSFIQGIQYLIKEGIIKV